MFPKMTADMELGASLLEKKALTTEQLREAFAQQKTKGGYLSQRLIELGFVKDAEMTTHLTCEFGYSYIPLSAYTISDDALSSIPFDCACDFCVLPIEKHGQLLTTAMADPLNKGVIELIRQISRCEIVVLISTRAEIRQAVQKYYGTPFKEFELDQYREDVVLRDDLMDREISNGLYTGVNRRRYKRLPIDLHAEYYLHPNFIKTEIRNISMSGILFQTDAPIPSGSELAINIHLDNYRYVTGVVEIIRSDPSHLVESSWGEGNRSLYDTGAFFSFMPRKNQEMLAQFIRRNLKS